MDETQVITINISMINEANIVYFLTVFLPVFLIIRTVKRSIPSLLGGG